MIDPRFYSVKGPLCLGHLLDGLAVDTPDPKFNDVMITAPSALAGSKTGDITFLGSKKNLPQLDKSKASACFVTEDLAPMVGARHILPIISKHPRAHFSRTIDRLVVPHPTRGIGVTIHPNANIHATAVIGDGAAIEEGAVIGPYAVIGAGVHIGANTRIDAHCVVEFCEIARECRVKSGAIIGGRGFGVDADERGLVDIAHIGRVIIGERVSIGSGSCIDRAQLGDTRLGDDVKIDNLVQIAHNVTIGAGTMIAAQTGISGSCVIGKGVIMGGSVGLADHLTIGDGVVIAARSGLMHNIPAGEKWGGTPAMPMRDFMKTVAATRRLIKPKKTKG
ncbi:UDP-3-O-(3-hydroxymyristoyl)glucosamine N-acyltransferase [Fretibacter rubidus]|uniref:UDP-3-O-(3-hydroxymyristoyl)glucosamine N-acyltransferase n=1 Tax=Fretibacter rubidus TaxID=570162 RepID=UPI00352B5CCE